MIRRRCIVISGGSKGLGQAAVQYFLASGWSVATFSRTATPFIRRCARREKARFLYVPVDATDPQQIEGFVRQVQERFGRIDVLVNNAGIAHDGVLPVFPDAKVESLIQVNLGATIRLTRACARIMLTQRSGNVVNMTSIVGLRGYRGLSVYSATKAALIGFTQSLARELGSRGIRVNALAPGFIETEMTHGLDEKQKRQICRRTPLGRLGLTQDIVSVLSFLASDASAFMTGQVLVVDGGLTC